MRERLLTQHFVRRFLENDLVSPDADRHEVLSLVGAGLLSATMFITIGLALKFMFMPLQSPGRTAILAVDDRLLFLTCAMIVMALVAGGLLLGAGCALIAITPALRDRAQALPWTSLSALLIGVRARRAPAGTRSSCRGDSVLRGGTKAAYHGRRG